MELYCEHCDTYPELNDNLIFDSDGCRHSKPILCPSCGGEIKDIYCHACSIASGSHAGVYHLPPECE